MLNKNFWLYAVGRWISQAGWVIQDIAVPLYVLDKTGSGTMMGLFVMAELIPRLLVNPIAGVIGDRYNRKALMVWLDIARGVLLFGVITLNLLDLRSLLVVQVIMSIMGSFFAAGISGMFPDLVKKEQLAQANSMLQSGGLIIRMVGPVVGGLIYALGGIKLAIMINAASFLGSGLFETLIEYRWETKELSSLAEVWSEMREGFRFIKDSRSLMILVSFAIILNTLLNPVFAVVLPYVSRVVLGFSSVQFGSIETAATVGALAGNIIIAGKLKESSENLLFKALLAQLLCLFVLAAAAHPYFKGTAYPMLIGTFTAFGFFNTMVNVPITTKLQKAVPNEVRARFFSAFETAILATTPLGMALIGPLLDIVDVSNLVAILVILSLIALAYYYINFKEIVMSVGTEAGEATV
ncbi:MFS transporter [Palaeococcus pacificus DY20341]|uniref:MFS transporter n=1 Tax=Palaeococcus pacificus DY20341 TaxID=1343739 RepID=A0A075LS20_9EURY|nr:MFS transporter [Palaeococcus pacificus]AIF68926.1 MFS transporter [Palaeococcus pacificus DY20341]